MAPTAADGFLEGSWTGEGEVVGWGLLRWLMPREPFNIATRFERLSGTLWVVRDHLTFARGGEIRRTMYVERTSERLYHTTADDMPLGADIEVTDRGYRYSPYWSWSGIRGRRWLVRVREEGTFLGDGNIEALLLISWHGIPIARNRLRLRRA